MVERQQAMMSTQSGDADEPRQQMTDAVPQQGTAELSGADICTPEQSAGPSASATVSGVAENTSRAAEFNTDCIRLVRWDGMPASVALP